MTRCTWWCIHEDERQRGSTTALETEKPNVNMKKHTKQHFQGLFWTKCNARNIHFLSSEGLQCHAMFLMCLAPAFPEVITAC
jgi:hypothetical protein